jgi:hypothetical protein
MHKFVHMCTYVHARVHTHTHKHNVYIFKPLPVSCILRINHSSSASFVAISTCGTFFSHTFGLVVVKSILFLLV